MLILSWHPGLSTQKGQVQEGEHWRGGPRNIFYVCNVLIWVVESALAAMSQGARMWPQLILDPTHKERPRAVLPRPLPALTSPSPQWYFFVTHTQEGGLSAELFAALSAWRRSVSWSIGKQTSLILQTQHKCCSVHRHDRLETTRNKFAIMS